jgi:hypothetical protein
MTGPILTTETGSILTDNIGRSIRTDVATSNADIQMFDFIVDLLAALLWQYNSATRLQSILQQKQDWYSENQTQFWTDWYTNVFNLATANEFGLNVWSIILNLPLFVNSSSDSLSKPTFGFNAGYFKNFGRGNFSSRTGGTAALSLEIKRIALQLRYFQLCSSGTVPEINRFLAYVFRNYGKAFLLDGHDMTQSYVFEFTLTGDLQYLFENFDLLPRPAGVGSTWSDSTRRVFGFGAANLNYNNGNFRQ